MSIQLPTVNFTGLSVGASGQVQIPQPKVQVGELGHLRLYNESGAGLDIVFSNGHGETVPAGAWPMFEIEPETQTFTWMITYVLPNAPVATMKMVYYFPYEGVPPTPALGNSPIGITGGVSTSSVQTLSNETNPANQLVLDVGDAGNVNLYTLYTDGHALWKVDASGVLHQVLKVNTAANFLQLGQASDITEVLGELAIDKELAIGDVPSNTTTLKVKAIADTEIGVRIQRHSATQSGNLLSIIDELSNALVSVDPTGIITAPAANILGTAGNLTHILGTLTVDQTSLFSGLLSALGVKSNAFRDNTNGNLAIDLSAGTGDVILPNTLQLTKAPVTANGSVAGNVNLYTPIWGSNFKLGIVTWAGYNSTTVTTLAFPSVLARGLWYVGNFGSATPAYNWQFSGGGALTMAQITSLAAGSGGGGTGTSFGQNVIGTLQASCNQLVLGTTAGVVINSAMLILGV